MLMVSPAVSPKVVANILMAQNPSVTAGTLVIVELREVCINMSAHFFRIANCHQGAMPSRWPRL